MKKVGDILVGAKWISLLTFYFNLRDFQGEYIFCSWLSSTGEWSNTKYNVSNAYLAVMHTNFFYYRNNSRYVLKSDLKAV